MLFQTTAAHEELRAKIRSFAEEEIKPLAFMMDQNNEFPEQAVKKLGKLGWMRIPFPKEFGDAGDFITSDNPAFQYHSVPESKNMNGYIFPLSPKYLLFIGSGNLPINIVDMRYADRNTVAYFNQAISRNKVQTVISRCRD